MEFGTRPLGRYVVDVDGCLRSTDKARLYPADVRALQGAAGDELRVTWELYGDQVVLGEGDHVPLDDRTVAFFRTHRISSVAQTLAGGVPYSAWPADLARAA